MSRLAAYPRVVVAICGALALLTVTASCGRRAAHPAPPPANPAASPTPPPSPSPTSAPSVAAAAPSPTPPPSPACGPTCLQQQRYAATAAHLAKQPGRIGMVVRDRTTGATWRAGTTTHSTWTASTIKLAMALSLLERARAGEFALSAKDRQNIADMLAFSSDDAADAIWSGFGGEGMVGRFRSTYGMTGLTFVPGFSRYWGFMKCTAEDLARLMSYLTDRANAADRGYLLGAMRGVSDNQRWGVWAAGPALRPGVKNGWSIEKDNGTDHWVTNTVGFAGPGERYVVAVMYDLPASGGKVAGVRAVSDAVALAFGAPTPAKISIPEG